MTPGQVVLLVVGILALNVAVWIPALLWVRSRIRTLIEALGAELDASGERTLVAPEAALYGGATGPYPRARGNVVVALTNRRVIVRRLVGAGFEIARDDVVSAREAASFHGRTRSASVVVVTTRAGGEIGLLVREPRAWVAALGHG